MHRWRGSLQSSTPDQIAGTGKVGSPLDASPQNVVLPRYTASANDADCAAARLLCRGPIRLKKPLAAGGRGQRTIAGAHELKEFLDTISPDDMALCEVVP